MTVAAVVAALMGEVAEGAMLAFLYSISEAAEGYTEAKTRSAVRGAVLMDLAPKLALVRRDGREADIRSKRWWSATFSSSSRARRSPPTARWCWGSRASTRRR